MVVVPVPKVEQLILILTSYASCHNETITPQSNEASPSRTIAYATSSAPRELLSNEQVYVIQQICGSITGLEQYTRTQGGLAKLSKLLDWKVVECLAEFWEDEWIA